MTQSVMLDAVPTQKPLTKLLQQAVDEKKALVTQDGKRRKITYVAVNHSENYDDPEEQVRAEFWAELIYNYKYDPRKIGVEITIPDRVPSDRADLVVYRDDERKRPYAVIECKRADISDAEYRQAVEQAFGNGFWAKLNAAYVMVVSGRTRTVYDVSDKFGVLERARNIIADLPVGYGEAATWKYVKGGAVDITPVSPYDLTVAIRKCHQTMWGGGRLSPTAAFGELCKIVFVKIQDETDGTKRNQPYQFQIQSKEPPHELAGRVKKLYAAHRAADPEIFSEKPRLLCVNRGEYEPIHEKRFYFFQIQRVFLAAWVAVRIAALLHCAETI